jgi:hypothetical protein
MELWKEDERMSINMLEIQPGEDSLTLEQLKGVQADRDEFLRTWNDVLQLKTGPLFEASWSTLIERYRSIKPSLTDYLKAEWYRWRFQFADCYINKFKHFGNTVTSRLEGSHSRLKDTLQNPKGDLYDVVDGINSLIRKQYNTLGHELTNQQRRVPYDLNIHEIKPLLGKVTAQGLRLLKGQLELAKRGDFDRICTSNFRGTYGIPCCHELVRELQRTSTNDYQVQLTEIDDHWLFIQPSAEPAPEPPEPSIDPLLLIEEPAIVQRRRGRPALIANPLWPDLSSTQREPSEFEVVAANNPVNRAIAAARSRRGGCGGARRGRTGTSTAEIASKTVGFSPSATIEATAQAPAQDVMQLTLQLAIQPTTQPVQPAQLQLQPVMQPMMQPTVQPTVQPATQPVLLATPTEPPPRRRGRPAGSKNAGPRKKRPSKDDIIADLQRQLATLQQQAQHPEPIAESTYQLREVRRPPAWLADEVRFEDDELELLDKDFSYNPDEDE